VTVNGESWGQFDAGAGRVTLRGMAGAVVVAARYEQTARD
jgi:hypothetical protein